MVPVFIGFQVKRALRTAADDSILSDITKMKLIECIMGKFTRRGRSTPTVPD